MSKVYCSVVVDAPVEQVWDVLRDFNGMPAWHPMVSDSRIEEEQQAATIGCVRTVHLTDGGHLRERLLALNDLDHSCTSAITDSHLPLSHYLAELRLRRVTADERTFVEWVGQYDVADTSEADVADAITTLYHTGLEALARTFASS